MNCSCYPGFFKSLPTRLVDKLCASEGLSELRRQALVESEGEVLEIGIGSGHNLSAYPWENITTLYGLEPSSEMLLKARENSMHSSYQVEYLHGICESIPLADGSIDTVVITFTLCSIQDIGKALDEVRRVLKPTGKVLFLEHQHESDQLFRHLFQSVASPLWKFLAEGCDLTNQPIKKLIQGNFSVRTLGRQSMKGGEWPMGECVWGVASVN